MQRVKYISYDEDDLYSDNEDQDPPTNYTQETYSSEDLQNFADLTPVVRAELSEAGLQASDREIGDALWHYYWDVGKSVAYLKNVRTPRQGRDQEEKKEGKGKKQGKEGEGKAKSKFDQAVERSSLKGVGGTETAKSTQQKSTTLSKQTEALKIDDQQSAAAPTQPKSKAKLLDVAKLWADSKATRRPSAAFVVIGHVDHGKSTLMGRLLLDTGAVGQREIDKHQKEATNLNKSSFALAWVMDTGTEERARGVTVDIATHPFLTSTTDFVILDAPGHRDFVPNMLAGAAMADLAVLVVDARQLESGMSVRGQTREHVLLAWAMGVEKVVVAVNKMDGTVDTGENGEWDEALFRKVKDEVSKFLHSTGFQRDNITFVPVSGLTGTNVVKSPPKTKPTSWVSRTSPPLLTVLETLAQSLPRPTKSLITSPPHLQISSLTPSPLTLTGRLTSGSLQSNQTLLLLPSQIPTTLRSIELSLSSPNNDDESERPYALPGDICTLHLSGTDPEAIPHLRPGDVVCAPTSPVPVVKNFVARVTALDALLPMGVDVHFGRLHVGGSIKTLISVVEGEGEEEMRVLRKKPRVVRKDERAVVRVEVERAVPVEVGGRVVLRAGGDTVGAGVVVRGVGGKGGGV